MKRSQPPRAPSPTPTAFSGISNYRTDSYRPLRVANNVPAVPSIDYRLVSRTHFTELSNYLASYLARAPPNSRSTARQKLTRLTIQQFHELSTDVYDELMRRKNQNEVPFLPVRDEFHPKRNQARQKLATLPTSRFEDLSSDVYYELARRYPEFKEEELRSPPSPGSNYDDYPSPDFPSNRPADNPTASRNTRASEDRVLDSGYGGSISGRRPSGEDRRRLNESEYNVPRRSDDAYTNPKTVTVTESTPPPASRRKPSADGPRKSDDRDREAPRRVAQSASSASDGTPAAPSSTATSGMIVPNKSTITEEDIEVPYARNVRGSAGTALNNHNRRDRNLDRASGPEPERTSDGEPESASDYADVRSPFAALNGLSARLRDVEADDDADAGENGVRSGDDYYDKLSFGRASASSDRSPSSTARPVGVGRDSAGAAAAAAADQERMRSDYEYRIAKMQGQLTTLQRDLSDAEARERIWAEGEARVRQMEEELRSLRRRAEEQSAAMRALQKELEELRETRVREQDREARRARDDQQEIQVLRERCQKLEEEHATIERADPELVEQLRSDMQGLLTELSDLSRRNDEIMQARDSDLIVIRDLNAQLKEYKRKYELAKTELRNVKVTSQLFLQAPKLDDQLPVSPGGGLADIHVTAFLSAIDSLLTAARSGSPTRVLTPMKAVVNAVTAIVEDIRAYEGRTNSDQPEMDPETLQALRERAEATLGNLVAASRTHATSAGMSPVSLLDAAASHVAATISEAGRTLCIRKATKAEQEQFAAASSVGFSGFGASNGFVPALRTVEESKSAHMRDGSTSSTRRGDSHFSPAGSSQISSPNRIYAESKRMVPSEPSSSDASTPPPIFDLPPLTSTGAGSDDSAIADGAEDAWAELKPYLEAQTESIVYAIQSVLSGVRSPTPSPTLSENLTQIITIVSSIVAVCKDNLPPGSAAQGAEVLRELGDHANRLSEVQAFPEVTKESRQVMAKSSFAVANAMKSLMKL